MSPLDDELRAALHGRAATLAPSPDPLAGIERRAGRIRRRRTATAVLGSALAVAAIGLAVPLLTPSPAPAPVLPAAPSPRTSPAAAPQPAELRFADPWDYRGDPSLVTASQRLSYTAQWAATQGVAATQVEWVPLFGQRYESSGQAEIVYAARVDGRPPVTGLVVSTGAGADYRFERPFDDGGDSLLVLRLDGDEVGRVLAVASPAAERLEYAPDGTTFRDMTVTAPGVGITADDGDLSAARVRLTLAGSRATTQVPAPDPPTTAGRPANLLDWPSRGTRSEGPTDEQVLLAFTRGITGTADPGAGASYRALFSGSTDAGVRFTYGQAWIDGQPAYTVGLATGGTQGDQPFLGPVTPDAPPVLAFLLCCQPGSSVETLLVVPVPGTGQVLYDDDATGGFRPVGEGQDYLDGVVLVDRDPRAQRDRLQLLDGNGDLDRPTFEGPVLDLLCALKGCG